MDGYTFPRCKLEKTPQDRIKKRRYFKIAELITLWKHAKPWDRALMLLALNCGFSKREIATLQPEEIIERKGRSYIGRYRTKTEVYGQWLLWPETVQALEYVRQFQKQGSRYAVVNKKGNPLHKGTPKGNENQVISNHWRNILDLITTDDNTFPRLSFKFLRKTGATFIRHLKIPNAAELASMYLAHGEASDHKDKLLSAYTTRPWKKLHKALMRLRKKLLPMITSVDYPWKHIPVRTSLKIVEKVRELKAKGMTQKDIAIEVGLHQTTIGKICRRHA